MLEKAFLLLNFLTFRCSSSKTPVVKQQEREFVTIKKLSKFFIFRLQLIDKNSSPLYKQISSLPLIKVNFSKCIEFKSSKDMENANQIVQEFNFFKVKVVADEKNDILNDTEVLIVERCVSNNIMIGKSQKIDSKLLFRFYKGLDYTKAKSLWHFVPKFSELFYQPDKKFSKKVKMFESSYSELLLLNNNINVYSISEVDFLNLETRVNKMIECRASAQLQISSSFLIVQKEKSIKDSRSNSILYFKPFVDQINLLTSFKFGFFEEREEDSNSWLKKLKKYVGSVQNDDTYANKKMVAFIILSLIGSPSAKDIHFYKTLLSKVKRRLESGSIYEDSFYLVVWNLPV